MVFFLVKRVLLVGAVAGLAWKTAAAELTVGPGKEHVRIENALAIAQAGDVIVVHPQADNAPYEKVALAVNRPRITIRAAAIGQRVSLRGNGFDYSGRGRVPRAIVQFDKGADGCVVEGFEFSGAHNESHNGAGVRINQANDVVVRGFAIHDNDMGIMSNGDGTSATAVNQLIEDCLIYRNGDLEEPGQNHNLYLGGTSVTLKGCEVHSSLTGHNVKSRAHRTVVFACYVHDSANREFDLVDGKGDTTAAGSDAVLAGNIIVKAKGCAGNRAVIHFGQDGGNEHDGTLHLIHNTIVTPFISPVVHLSSAKARAQLVGNIVWDGGASQDGQVLISAKDDSCELKNCVDGDGNWLASGFKGARLDACGLQRTFLAARGACIPFADPAKGDYRLTRSDPTLVDKGCDLAGDVLKVVEGALLEYRHPQRSEPRLRQGAPDIGASEFDKTK